MDLGYLNARIHAWKGGLLTGEIYDRLTDAGDREGLDSNLDTYLDSYKDSLREMTAGYGRLIEIAEPNIKKTENLISYVIKKNFDEQFALLWQELPDQAKPLLKVLISPWEASALKTIIRGIEKNAPRSELINSLGPAGEFNKSAIEELSLAANIQELHGILVAWGSPYSVPIGRVLKSYLQNKHLYDLELAIDKFSLTHHLSAIPDNSLNCSIVRNVLKDRVDSANIMTLFKLTGESLAKDLAKELFIEKGRRLSAATFLSLLGIKDREELATALAEAVGDKDWQKVLYSAKLTGALTLEEELEFITGRRLVREGMREPLSIAPAAAYLYRLKREAVNLRLILRSKEFAIPRQTLFDDKLIMVYDMKTVGIGA